LRSAFLILGTLALLGVGFGVYFWMQPPSAALNATRNDSNLAPNLPRPTTSGAGIGPGQRAWMIQTDKNGQPTMQFRAEEHIPQSDKTVRVVKPEAEFFLEGGKILTVVGDHGVVSLSQGAPRKKQAGVAMPQSGTPNHGELKDVVIRLFESEQEARSKDGRPTLTLHLDNVSFDNELYRITTEAADIDGKRVERDQIPVRVRGDDYDFDGRGLTISLNEKDRRLELLEIAHGEKLTIKNPQALEKSKTPTTPNNEPAPDRFAGGGTPPSSLPASAPKTKAPAVYRASFQKDVRIIQGTTELATGDEFQVDFLSRSAKASPSGSNTVQQKRISDTSPQQAPPASSQAKTTAPEPIVIYWTDKLTVTPVSELDMSPNQRLVRMLGSPVIVHQHGGQMRGRRFDFDTLQGHLIVQGSPDFPLEMTDGTGGKATSDSLDYYRDQHVAEFHGRGSFTSTGRKNATTQSTMQARWSQLCRLHFVGENEQSMAIDRADFTGDVKLDDPTAKLNAQSLAMEFDVVPKSKSKSKDNNSTPTSAPKHLLATGDVHGQVLSSNGKTQSIDSQRLEMFTAKSPQSGGGIYVQKLIADGKVRAADEKDSIAADHLAATMVPVAKAMAVKDDQLLKTDVVELLADGAVNIQSKDGAGAQAEHLHLQGQGDQQSITLTGALARVQSKGSLITGPTIVARPALQLYQVDGAGTMHSEQQQRDPKKASTTRPVDVTWQKNFRFDGRANVGDVTGKVVVTSLLSDGSQTSSTSEQVRLMFADKPAVASTTKPSKEPQTSLAGMGSNMDQLKNKEVQKVYFFDESQQSEAHLQALKPDPQGNLAQQFDLYGMVIQYDARAEQLTVPGKGRIGLDDLKSKQSRGMTGVRWERQFTYDKPKELITIDGDIYISNKPGDAKHQPFDMKAQRVTLDTQRAKTQAGRDVGFRKMTAEGNVECYLKGRTVSAPKIEYDPVADTVLASGNDQARVEIRDENGVLQGSVQSWFYNRNTDEVRVEEAQVRSSR